MILFKDLKPGMEVYLFNRNEMSMRSARVEDVTPPHMSTNPRNIGSGKLVVDLSVNIDNTSFKYEVPDYTGKAYTETLTIITDLTMALNEIRDIKATIDNRLASVELDKTNSEKCSKLLEEWDPIFKQQQQTEHRFNSLEKRVDDMGSSLSKMLGMMEDLHHKLS